MQTSIMQSSSTRRRFSGVHIGAMIEQTLRQVKQISLNVRHLSDDMQCRGAVLGVMNACKVAACFHNISGKQKLLFINSVVESVAG